MTGTETDEGPPGGDGPATAGRAADRDRTDRGAGSGAGPDADADAGAGAGADAGVGAETEDAFAALGNELRLATLRTLLDRELAGETPATFSELFAASGAERSAGFAYHLRQLRDRYVRKVGPDGDGDAPARGSGGDGGRGDRDAEGYVLTYAGRKVARAVAAGTYTDSVDVESVPLDDPCPHCGAGALSARVGDNVVGVACGDCDRPVLSLPFPPRGYRDRDPDSVPRAVDAHHRHRLALCRQGVCPECAGRVEASVAPVPAGRTGDGGARPADAGGEDGTDGGDRAESEGGTAAGTGPDPGPSRALCTFACGSCGHRLRAPLALSLLTHPAVVAFHHDHGVDVRERPLWNVGDEFREAVVSTEPTAAVVSVELDGELLELFVDGAARVVDSRRTAGDGADGDEDVPDGESGPGRSGSRP